MNGQATLPSPSYSTVDGDVSEDRERVLQVWEDGGFHTGRDRNRGRYDWFYLHNPAGRVQLTLLRSADELEPVGTLAIGPRTLYMDGVEVPAGVFVDFVVHPEHRSAIPALKLQQHARRRARMSMDILYGMPNDQSLKISLLAGHDLTLEVGEYVRQLRTRSYLERRTPRWVATVLAPALDTLNRLGLRMQAALPPFDTEWEEGFNNEFDELWDSLDRKGRCLGRRDAAFLRWRFADRPGHTYRTFVVRQRPDGKLLGYFVCSTSRDALVVHDWLAGPQLRLRKALLALGLAGYREGASSVRLLGRPDPLAARSLRNAQFLRRGSRTFFAVIADELKEQAASLHWHITTADEDV
ncbi:MAG: hypothetical protein WD942_06715 [Dehalococcoidia bacterium]